MNKELQTIDNKNEYSHKCLNPFANSSVAYPSGGMGALDPPLFQNMVLKICPKMLENVSRRAFPRIYKSLKDMVPKDFPAYAPIPPTSRVLYAPLEELC